METMARSPKRTKNKKALTFSQGIFLGGVLALVISAAALEFTQKQPSTIPESILTPGAAKVCFTPGRACQQLILNQLASAKKSIQIQAYSFTDREITKVLVKKKREGVDVQVILDKSNKKDPQGQVNFLKKNNIPVRIDSPPGIAHNKIILIDHETLITGSYNFSVSAYKRNAENVLVLKDKDLVYQYIQNWQHRWSLSKTG